MAVLIPKRGDSIIIPSKDDLGNVIFTTTLPFQTFLESLTAEDDVVDVGQVVLDLSASIGAIRGAINKEIAARDDLEQIVYDN